MTRDTVGKDFKFEPETPFAPSSAVAPSSGSYPGAWGGRFIWDECDPLPVNCYMMFRKTFSLNKVPANALLMIAAADKYQLWINGTSIRAMPPSLKSATWEPIPLTGCNPRLMVPIDNGKHSAEIAPR